MNISEIEKGISYRIKLTIQQKKAGVSAIIFGFIAHMYFMCNLLLNDDTVVNYYASNYPYQPKFLFSAANSGRWLMILAGDITTWVKPPFISGVLIILCLAALAMILVDLLEIKSVAGSINCGALVAVFPSVTALMSLKEVGYTLSVLLVALSIYLSEKRKLIIVPIIFCGMGLSIMPVNISYVLVLYIYVLLKKILNDDVPTKEIVCSILKEFFIILCGVIIVYLGLLISFRVIGSSQVTSYQGGEAAVTGNWVRNIIPNLSTTIEKTQKLHTTIQMIPQLKFTIEVCYIIQIICIGILFINKKMRIGVIKTIILVFSIIILPYAISAISVISPDFQYSWHHRSQWMMPLCGVWLLFELALNSISNSKVSGLLYHIVVINMALMVYGFALTDNIVYKAMYYVAERDTAICTRMAATLDSLEGFSYDENPVYIVKMAEVANADNTTSILKAEPELYRTIAADLETNLWCYGDIALRSHMKVFEGVDLKYPSEEFVERIQSDLETILQEHADMEYGDFDVFRYEDTNTYVIVIKIQVSQGIIDNR